MGPRNLAVRILQQIAERSVKNTFAAARERRGMFPCRKASSRRLHPDHFHRLILVKRMKQSDGIGSAADTGEQDLRQSAFQIQDLAARFFAYHRLEIADDHRKGM